MMKLNFIRSIIPVAGLMLFSCEAIIPDAPADEELLDREIDGLSFAEQQQFLEGDIAFEEVFTVQTGLGPLFDATSCASCHLGDGKGHPFSSLIRFGQIAPGEIALPTYPYGPPQLQRRAIPGYEPGILPSGEPHMVLTPPAVTGLGLLAALTDEQILANADPDDIDGDGISGRPNYVPPPDYFVPDWYHQPVDGKYLGRFGKKAAAVDLLQQTVTAYKQDMGINSEFDPIDTWSGHPVDPEVSNRTVHDVVFYLRTLAPPLPRNQGDPQVQHGKGLFNEIQCAACHIPQWTTPQSDIAALSDITFYPYTDLLLHDMGPELDDGVTEGAAETYEWRTPPLWGLGLSPDHQGGQYFLMHDGRARSVEEAILLHGGEAAYSRNAYEALSREDREALLTFLESL